MQDKFIILVCLDINVAEINNSTTVNLRYTSRDLVQPDTDKFPQTNPRSAAELWGLA